VVDVSNDVFDTYIVMMKFKCYGKNSQQILKQHNYANRQNTKIVINTKIILTDQH